MDTMVPITSSIPLPKVDNSSYYIKQHPQIKDQGHKGIAAQDLPHGINGQGLCVQRAMAAPPTTDSLVQGRRLLRVILTPSAGTKVTRLPLILSLAPFLSVTAAQM